EKTRSGRGTLMAETQLACRRVRHGSRSCWAPAGGPSDADLLALFARQRDEAAFALLVERHGPMVWNVCRRLSENEQDAEDTFQATFLVLVRRADSLQNPELVASWLYGVAQRTARKAQAQTNRRRQQERRAEPVATVAEPSRELAWRELRSTLE